MSRTRDITARRGRGTLYWLATISTYPVFFYSPSCGSYYYSIWGVCVCCLAYPRKIMIDIDASIKHCIWWAKLGITIITHLFLKGEGVNVMRQIAQDDRWSLPSWKQILFGNFEKSHRCVNTQPFGMNPRGTPKGWVGLSIGLPSMICAVRRSH